MERTSAWHEANQRVLAAAVGAMREALDLVAHDPADASAATLVEQAVRVQEAQMPSPSSLSTLVSRFQLTPFERDLLVLCAGIELDSMLAAAWQSAVGTMGARHPTLSLALEVLPNAHWSAITPGSVLRRARLITLGDGPTLGSRPLTIAEPVLHFLNGLAELDPRLDGVVAFHREPLPLLPFQRLVAERVVRILEAAREAGEAWPVIAISTADGTAGIAVAAQAAAGIGATLCRLFPGSLSASDEAIADLVDLWDRDSILLNAGLFVDLTQDRDPERRRLVRRALNRQRGLIFVASPSVDDLTLTRKTITLQLRRLTPDDRRTLWRELVGADAEIDARSIDLVADAYPLDATAIMEVAHEVRFRVTPDGGGNVADELRKRCRQRVRGRIDPLAYRIEAAGGWNDLVLPPPQVDMLRSVAAQIRNRPRISKLWAPKGPDIVDPPVLFLGERGTGKTMAAAVIANQLDRDLYRIDAADLLAPGPRAAASQIREIVRATDGAGVILLVQLTEDLLAVRGMESGEPFLAGARALLALSGRAPVIFESGDRETLPASFLAGIRAVVRFPHPSADLRRDIWRRIFPKEVECKDLDHEKLARLPLVGGSIRSIAFDASLRAAEAGGPVTMAHLEQAARVEYAKLGRSLSPIETRGWVLAPGDGGGEQREGEKR